jgi:putative ABC transport system permease protein
MPLLRLTLSTLLTRRVRTALTLAAVALSVSLVVAVTTGYKSAEASIYQYLVALMGSTDVQVTHKNDFRQSVNQSLIARFAADPDVAAAYGRLETDTGLVDAAGKPVPGASAQLIGVDRPADQDITRSPIEPGGGAWFESRTGDVAVVDGQAAEVLKVKPGDTFALPGVNQTRRLKVVGICHKPAILSENVPWIYVPLTTCQELANRPNQVTRVMVNLKRGVDLNAFAARWEPLVKAVNPDLKLRLARDTRPELERDLAGPHMLSYIGGAVALMVAAFIIFTTLSMGVTERQRTLAMLRAVGALRSQVARLVAIEGLILGLAGALIGAPLGLLWAYILAFWKPDYFDAGVVINWTGVGMGLVAAGACALVAAIIPAWTASRVSPLEAMTPLASGRASMRGPVVCAIIGLPLIFADTFSIFVLHPSPSAVFYEHFFFGLPVMFVGFFLIAPLTVWFFEKLLGRLLPVLMRVRGPLLRHQLSGGVWRAAGTASALMMGLCVLVVLQTVGHSMLNGWRLPTHFPDIFIYTGEGLTRDQWQQLDQTKGVRPGEVMAMTFAFPELPGDLWGKVGLIALPNATMFIGVEPDKSLRMMDLEFREGTARSAAAAMARGGNIVVTEEFRVLKHLHLGDSLTLMTKTGPKPFKICGVVWSPGIDVMVQMFDMGRMFDQRTAASVFGSIDDAEKEFGKDKAFLFAADLDDATDKAALLKNVKERLGERGWKAGDVREIKRKILTGFARLLNLLSTVAFAAMAVAALGVANTVMASVRSRQWQFGVLRAIGVTRGQLLRLILAESVLLGVAGAALGLAAGFILSVNATGLSRIVLGFVFTLTPPWGVIALGTLIILAVAALASFWPARQASRSETLALLQAGRAAV